MRNNQPVTTNELKVPADQTLISVTDLKGRITYANPVFVSMSGYLPEELIGQAHSIVRHPDMPAEAFRDLWATIEQGLPWTGVVKNRRKNGDHYWVRANATPMRDGDTTVGYLSVRTAATEAEIQAASGLYALMREEAQRGRLVHVLDKGKVIRAGAIPALFRALRPGMRGQLGWLALLAATGPVLAAALGAPLVGVAAAGVATALVAAALAWSITGGRLAPLVETAHCLASGDLSHEVSTGSAGHIGQLEQALAQMTLNVRTVVRDIRHEVGNLRGGAQEIALGNQDMSSRVESQASNLKETASSMDDIRGAVQKTSNVASEGATLANDTLAVARRSHDAVQAVSDTMEGIAESSRRIGDITQVIEGVAFQTNILALNAAVEAARAGEAGRGFAVVASEVRALAQRTSAAAKEIRGLIEESHARVDLGNTRVTDARARVDESMAAVGQVTGMLQDIRVAATDQLDGVSQISEAISEMDGITQQNAAMVEELAAASQALTTQVDAVHSSIRVFRLRPGDQTLAELDAVALRKENKSALSLALKPDELDFDKVIAAHQQWRVTLRNAALKGKQVDADTVRRDDCCALGKWIHGPGGQRWSNVATFTTLVGHHKTFHLEAAKVAEVINAGQVDKAQRMMDSGTPFVEAGHQVTQAIRDIRRLSQADSAPPAAPAPVRPKGMSAAPTPANKAAPTPKAAQTALPVASAGNDDWETF
ncbi:MAG: chemotaxis protein [Polaromonas sp.]|nr:chemotaxis protein [Polaromonas sp.]